MYSAYLLAGTEYIPSTEIRIPELPLRWCIIYVYGLYLLSDFPFRMKEKIGSAQILALRSQTGWWLEKLFWTFLVGDRLFDNRDIDDYFVLCLA